MGSLLEERPGVTTRDTEHKAAIDYTRDLLGTFFLSVFTLLLQFYLMQFLIQFFQQILFFMMFFFSFLFFVVVSLTDMYNLFDVEEDEDLVYPGKDFGSPPSIYTFTNSTVMHPDHKMLITSS